MPKISTFDGATFWKNAYAHQRGKLLTIVGISEEEIKELANTKYEELPAQLKYKIETSGIKKKDLN